MAATVTATSAERAGGVVLLMRTSKAHLARTVSPD
jgi:hypothetical protein